MNRREIDRRDRISIKRAAKRERILRTYQRERARTKCWRYNIVESILHDSSCGLWCEIMLLANSYDWSE